MIERHLAAVERHLLAFGGSWQPLVPLIVIHLSAKTPPTQVGRKHSKSSRQALNEIGADGGRARELCTQESRGSRLGVGWSGRQLTAGGEGERRGWVPRQTNERVSKNNQPRVSRKSKKRPPRLSTLALSPAAQTANRLSLYLSLSLFLAHTHARKQAGTGRAASKHQLILWRPRCRFLHFFVSVRPSRCTLICGGGDDDGGGG